MRAGVLSKDKIIEFLNENFINTWVTSAELGKTPNLRAPIAKRREREGKTYDINHPLAQAIMKGWKTGSQKGSPVDCLIISPALELMGRQPVNEFFADNRRRKLRHEESYLVFLKESLEDKFPGLGNVVLTSEHPSQEVLDAFRIPTVGYQNYTVVVIDTRAFENGGTLTIDIEVGRGDAVGFFYLFDGDSELPTAEKVPEGKLASAWISPGDTRQIMYRFDRGQFFKLGATGSWRPEKGDINAFYAKISVEVNQNENVEK